jgi:hypothetical protein
MKAILELNEFQKIIEIPRPEPMLRMYYRVPGHLLNLQEAISSDVMSAGETLDIKILEFFLEGQIGEFLLYQYKG